jgi:hypothetical protein
MSEWKPRRGIYQGPPTPSALLFSVLFLIIKRSFTRLRKKKKGESPMRCSKHLRQADRYPLHREKLKEKRRIKEVVYPVVSWFLLICNFLPKVTRENFDIQRRSEGKRGKRWIGSSSLTSCSALLFLDVLPPSFVFAVARANLLHGIVTTTSRAAL